MSDDVELYHYGVVGMKWGVRRNPSESFSKSAKKAEKIKHEIDKLERKTEKKKNKLDKAGAKYAGFGRQSKNQLRKKTASYYRTSRKLSKKQKKLDKWERQMQKTFGKVKISDITQKDIIAGRDYVQMLKKK